MAVIKRYFPKFTKQDCRYITVSPCGRNYEPYFEMWSKKPMVACNSCNGRYDWVGTGNITHTGESNFSKEQLEKLGWKYFSYYIKNNIWKPETSIIELNKKV